MTSVPSLTSSLMPPAMPSSMPSADPLAQLRDIHLPGDIDSWVMTPGWWLLLALASAAMIFAAARYRKHQQQVAYRLTAIDLLNALTASMREHQNTSLFLQQLTTLLKQVSLSSYPRAQVAGLTGIAWVAFLDKSGDTSEFSMGSGQALVDGGYTPDSEVDIEALTELCRQWIRHHRDNEGRQVSFFVQRQARAPR